MKAKKYSKILLPTLTVIALAINGPVVHAQEIDLEHQLILFMPMNGNALDESGINVPTLVEGPVLTADRFGNPNSAYLFDGVNDQIRLNNNLALITTKQYTICAWARMDGQSQALFHSNSLFEQRAIDPGGQPVVIHFNADQENLSRHIVRSSAEVAEYKTDTDEQLIHELIKVFGSKVNYKIQDVKHIPQEASGKYRFSICKVNI